MTVVMSIVLSKFKNLVKALPKNITQPVRKRSFFFQVTRTHNKNLGFPKAFLLRILSFILVSETCFHVTVLIDIRPKVRV